MVRTTWNLSQTTVACGRVLWTTFRYGAHISTATASMPSRISSGSAKSQAWSAFPSRPFNHLEHAPRAWIGDDGVEDEATAV